jgi:Na+-driven multidrug efflux pump
MSDKNNEPIENRMTIPEAMRAGETSFISSWWSLFIFVIPVSLFFYPQLYDYLEPFIESIQDKDAKATMQYLAFISYLIITVVFPFLFFYKFDKYLKKKKRSK